MPLDSATASKTDSISSLRLVHKEANPTQKLMALSLRANFSWSLLGNTVYAGCQWGMLVALAKLSSPETVGQFTLGFAITAPIVIFANLALRQVQATDANYSYEFSDYLSLRILTSAIAVVLVIAIASFSSYDTTTKLVIVSVGIAKSFESISDIFYGLFQRYEQMDRIGLSRMMKGGVSLFVLVLTVTATGDILAATISLALVWFLFLLIYDVRNGYRLLTQQAPSSTLAPEWRAAKLRQLVRLALPLGLATMIVSLNTNIPRYFVEWQLGSDALGIYAALSYLIVIGGTVVNALGQAASPRLANYYAESNQREFIRLLGILILTAVVFGVVGLVITILFGRPLLAIIYTSEYSQHIDILVWLVLNGMVTFVASFLGYGLTASRMFRIQPFLYGTSVVTVSILCALLIPRFALRGAVGASLGASIIQLLGASLCILLALRRTKIR